MSASRDLAHAAGVKLESGKTYAAWFPFKREKYRPHPEPENPGVWDGKYVDQPERDTWVPGWTTEACGSDGGDTSYGWRGDGAMLLTVVSLHKPGPTYPERAFYIRQWRDPDGRVFGKNNLRCISSRALLSWLVGAKTKHLFEDHAAILESSRALFEEALALATASPAERPPSPRETQ